MPLTYIDALAARIRSKVAVDLLPKDTTEGEIEQLFRLYALIGLVAGLDVSSADVHDAWSTWMLERAKGDHASVVPFSELDNEEQEQDDPFLRAIRGAVAGDA